ncbi:MAG: alpha-1,2-mannosidase [Zoogloeaceae bacterium]|nr:alpha-1,2-mannosidase [Rhodocyclaceae bacterium]MCP5234505.1 alpha-1,2-mannosidase [Zoogloeaceae bacterium]
MIAALRRLRHLVVPLAWLLALGCAAAVAATLFWRYAAPPRSLLPVRSETDPRAVAQRINGQHPFAGEAPAKLAVAAGGGAARVAVIGLATGFDGGTGFALLKSGDDAPQAYVEGESLADGVTLRRILADGVELERNGRVERLSLPTTSTEGVITAAGAGAPAVPSNAVPTSEAASRR